MGRIWVNPDGLRIDGDEYPNLRKAGGGWEDESDYDEDEPEVERESINTGDYNATAALRREFMTELARLRASQPVSVQGPSSFSRFYSWARRLLIATARPVPTIAAWSGIIGTVFWHAAKSLPEQPFGDFIELGDGSMERYVAAGLETAIFCVWTVCFRHTVRVAIRSEIDDSKGK